MRTGDGVVQHGRMETAPLPSEASSGWFRGSRPGTGGLTVVAVFCAFAVGFSVDGSFELRARAGLTGLAYLTAMLTATTIRFGRAHSTTQEASRRPALCDPTLQPWHPGDPLSGK